MKPLLVIGLIALCAFTSGRGQFAKKYTTLHDVANANLQSAELEKSEPLFLTPYIEAGKLAEGRKLSEVKDLPGGAPQIKSHSGFLTVNKQYNSNMFFWFFPALSGKTDVPVILWLQGGPGGDSMYGLFVENGPLQLRKDNTVFLRNATWNQEFAVIYIDNPVGAGFSFTDNDEGYAETEEDVARNLYEALKQFFTLFEDYRGNPFFITGESYAGKYIPAIAHKIHREGEHAKRVGINLEGLAIGDGWCDPRNMGDRYGEYLFEIGLLDERQREHFFNEEAKFVRLVDEKNYARALDVMSDLLNGNAQGTSYFQEVTGLDFYYNYLKDGAPDDFNYYLKYLALTKTRKAIHVGNRPFQDGSQAAFHLNNDIMVSVKPWVEQLLDANYRTLFYSGQLDIIVAAPLTENFLKKLHWKGEHKYYKADRKIYRVSPKGKVAGYVRKIDNLYYAIIRNAGHILPYDQPEVAQDMIRRFVKKLDF